MSVFMPGTVLLVARFCLFLFILCFSLHPHCRWGDGFIHTLDTESACLLVGLTWLSWVWVSVLVTFYFLL